MGRLLDIARATAAKLKTRTGTQGELSEEGEVSEDASRLNALNSLVSPRGLKPTAPAQACAECQRFEPIMLAMAPGDDGRPWALCSPCWRGVR